VRLSLLCLTLAACSDYAIKGHDTPPGGGDDTDVTVDTDDTEDTDVVVDPDDCDLDSAPAGPMEVSSACTGSTRGTVTDPYNLSIEYQYTSDLSGVVIKPSVINLTDDNGDGATDTADIPDIVFTVYGANELVALSGDYSGELFRKSGWYGAGGIATADVNGDGEPDICGFDTSLRVQCTDSAGNLEWTSSGASGNYYPEITVCDLDEDGTPEVIGDTQVINGVTGATEFTLTWDGTYTVPVCADLDQDGRSEIILGRTVFDDKGKVKWTMASSGGSNMAAVVNADADDDAEVFLASDKLYLYDTDGKLLNSSALPGANPGPPCAADFDGDGEVEIAVPDATTFSMFDTDGTKLWSATMQDYSGLAGCSGYDMDGDGIYEVLFADEVAVRLYDGATGGVLYSSTAHNSGTLFEYPVVADVDQDGSAEIIVAENLGALNGVTVYGHGGDGWPKAGPTWATHDFAVTNVDPDGHVPQVPEPSWLKYNVFRARPAIDNPSTPDLFGEIVDVCAADCDNGPVEVSVQVKNQGAADLAAGLPWTFYRNDGGVLTQVTHGVLPAITAGTAAACFEILVTPDDLGDDGFVVGLDDSGSGVDGAEECDAMNNRIAYTDEICPRL
jgi:hypothetical protein